MYGGGMYRMGSWVLFMWSGVYVNIPHLPSQQLGQGVGQAPTRGKQDRRSNRSNRSNRGKVPMYAYMYRIRTVFVAVFVLIL
jgi:hypothetical protein